MQNTDLWVIRPFNTVFLTVFAAFLALLALSSILLRKKSENTRRWVLIAACLVTFVGYFIYKYALSLDAEYDVITANMGGFNWWGELPLQLCNINMILIPIAVWRKSRPLMCFSFFLGPLGAAMALVMPGNGFDGYSLLLPRMLGYYGTHFMIIMEGLALAAFGLFRPRLKDIPRAILAALAITFVIFLIDLLLRAASESQLLFCGRDGGQLPAGDLPPLDPRALPVSAAQHRHSRRVYDGDHRRVRARGPAARAAANGKLPVTR